MDSATIKVKAIATQAESYDVLVGAMVLYPMSLTIDFWNETMSYRLEWQASDRHQAIVHTGFIRKAESHHVKYTNIIGSVEEIVVDEYSTQPKMCSHRVQYFLSFLQTPRKLVAGKIIW